MIHLIFLVKIKKILILSLLITGLGTLLPCLVQVKVMAMPKEKNAAEQSLQKLIAGNGRFMSGNSSHDRQDATRRKQLSAGQSPFVAILGCSDSRVAPEIIFDQGLGDLFVVRGAGNTSNDTVLGSLEFAAESLKVPLIVVLGHESCGAVQGSLAKGPLPGHLENIAEDIRPAIEHSSCKKPVELSCATHANVEWVVKQLKSSKPILAPLVDKGKIRIIGAYYNLESGKVEFLK